MLEEAKLLVEDFLRSKGLAPLTEKTKIVHIEEGFDFLGWNVRKYDGKLLIKPAKKNVQAFMRHVRSTIRETRTATQEEMIACSTPSSGDGPTTIGTPCPNRLSERWITASGNSFGNGHIRRHHHNVPPLDKGSLLYS